VYGTYVARAWVSYRSVYASGWGARVADVFLARLVVRVSGDGASAGSGLAVGSGRVQKRSRAVWLAAVHSTT
jgi:hypothetical protein